MIMNTAKLMNRALESRSLNLIVQVKTKNICYYRSLIRWYTIYIYTYIFFQPRLGEVKKMDGTTCLPPSTVHRPSPSPPPNKEEAFRSLSPSLNYSKQIKTSRIYLIFSPQIYTWSKIQEQVHEFVLKFNAKNFGLQQLQSYPPVIFFLRRSPNLKVH